VDRVLPTVIVVVVLVGVLLLMLRSWRRRSRRDAALASGYPAPDTSTQLESVESFYVATTPRDAPLERLAIRSLAFRARATLSVTDAGVVIDPNGETPVFIPVSALERVTEATWAIDRAVETGGLLLIGWRLNTAPTASDVSPASVIDSVDSYFRITDPADRTRIVAALRTLVPEATGPDLSTESEA